MEELDGETRRRMQEESKPERGEAESEGARPGGRRFGRNINVNKNCDA